MRDSRLKYLVVLVTDMALETWNLNIESNWDGKSLFVIVIADAVLSSCISW
jgi:hypothetical protein